MDVVRKCITFFQGLIGSGGSGSGAGSGSTSMSTMNVSTAGGLSALGQFVLSLTCDQSARNAWMTNRAQAIANSGLSAADQQLLTAGDPVAVGNQIVMESGGSGSILWICVWIR